MSTKNKPASDIGPPATTRWSAEVEADPQLLNRTDIWVSNILPFVGPGNFVFVAGVSHRMKELYQTYFAGLEKPPCMAHRDPWVLGKMTASHTFYRAAFSSLSCAEYWRKKDGNHHAIWARYYAG